MQRHCSSDRLGMVALPHAALTDRLQNRLHLHAVQAARMNRTRATTLNKTISPLHTGVRSVADAADFPQNIRHSEASSDVPRLCLDDDHQLRGQDAISHTREL